MKNARVWITLSGGLASGLLAGYLALVYVSEEPTPLQAYEPEGAQIVAAGRDLPSGTIVTREDLEVVEWPGGNLPEGFLSQPGEVVGRGVIGFVHRNEPLLDTKLASKEAGGGLPITIPAGLRALSVEVDEVIGVAGFVLPGTQVDVLKEDTFATKSRLLLLRESVLRRSIAGSKLVVVHEDDLGAEFTLQQVLYGLDRIPKFQKIDTKKGLASLDGTVVIDEKIVPGSHTLVVQLVYRGNDWVVFRYMQGYTFRVRSAYTFVAEEGIAHEIIVRAYEKGDFLTPLEERPTVSFETNNYDLENPTAAASQRP